MKYFFSFLAFSLFSLGLVAQSPFDEIAPETKIAPMIGDAKVFSIPLDDSLGNKRFFTFDADTRKIALYEVLPNGDQNVVIEKQMTGGDSKFPSVDPIAKDFPWYSPYQFGGNDVIRSVDLDGLEPKITITNERTGHTLIKVYGAGNITAMSVPTYAARITYIESDGSETFLGSFNVTRDGWYDHGLQSNGSSLLINRSSDPPATLTGEIRGQGIKYGDAPVYIFPDFYAPIKDNQTNFTDGTPLPEDMQRTNGIASGAMLHIGGFYTSNGKTNLGGTYGCYGVVDPSQVLLNSQTSVLLEDYQNGTPLPSGITPSNTEMHRVGGLIEERRKATWFGLSKEPVLFEIQKRDTYETKQDARKQ